jgi:hypothetical protein
MEKNGQMPHAASVVERATMGSRGGEREDAEGRRWSGRAGGVRAREAAEPTLLSTSANWETDGTRTDVNLTRSEGPLKRRIPARTKPAWPRWPAATLARLHARCTRACWCWCSLPAVRVGVGVGSVQVRSGQAGQVWSGLVWSGLVWVCVHPSALAAAAASCTSTAT